MSKKILSVVLALTIMLAIAPVSVFAQDDVLSHLTYEINNGEVTISACDESISGDVIIPDTIDGYPVTTIGEWAFGEHESLITVTIPESVTLIGIGAFILCYNLEYITVDENNLYYSSDEYGVLFNKNKTELIQYPAGNSRTTYTIPDSVMTIGTGAFVYSQNLKSVTIANGVTLIDDTAFATCISLESVTIPESVTSIGIGAFAECISITDVYYGGSEADWADITTAEENECLTSATIHYNYIIDEPATEDPETDEPVTEENINTDNNNTSESDSSFLGRIIEFFINLLEKIRQFFESVI